VDGRHHCRARTRHHRPAPARRVEEHRPRGGTLRQTQDRFADRHHHCPARRGCVRRMAGGPEKPVCALDAAVRGNHAVDHRHADGGFGADLFVAQPRAVSRRHLTFRQRQRVAGIAGLINRRRQVLQRVARLVMPPGEEGQTNDHDGRDGHETGEADLPVQFRQQQDQRVHDGVLLLDQRRRLAEFFRPLQFRVQRGEQRGDVQLEQLRVNFHRTAYVDRRGEGVEFTLFERTNMVRADLRRRIVNFVVSSAINLSNTSIN